MFTLSKLVVLGLFYLLVSADTRLDDEMVDYVNDIYDRYDSNGDEVLDRSESIDFFKDATETADINQ